MSYDFRLFRQRAGEDPIVTANADSDELPSGQPDPEKEALKCKVADALIAHNPRLQVFQFDYEAIAEWQKITVEEARLKFRHLELNGPKEKNRSGIQIILFDDGASVTVPFWHESTEAVNSFREVWDYLEIVCRVAGYLIYDPQIDRVLAPLAGLDGALSCYTKAMRRKA